MKRERLVVIAGWTPRVLSEYSSPPLATGVLTSYLRVHPDLPAGTRVEAAEFCSLDSDEEVIQHLEAMRPWLIGWSCYVWNIKRVVGVLPRIRRALPSCRLVLGGPQVSDSGLARYLMGAEPAIDAVVLGEGEERLAKYIRHLSTDGRQSPCTGTLYRREDGTTIEGGHRCEEVDLRTAPSPYLTGTCRPDAGSPVYVNLESYRGCPFRCSFCKWGREQVRFRRIEQVSEELEWALSNPDVVGGFFCDADFFLNQERSCRLLDLIAELRPDSTWYLEGEPTSIDSPVIQRLRKLPKVTVSFGLQSIDDGVLRRSGRPRDTTEFARGVRRLHQEAPQLGINLGLIYGLPGERLSGFLDSVSFALGLAPTSLTLSHLELLPGTEFFRDPADYGIRHTGPPDFCVTSTTHFGEDDFMRADRISAFVRACFNYCFLRETVANLAVRDGVVCGQTALAVYLSMLDDLTAREALPPHIPRAVSHDLEQNLERARFHTFFSTAGFCHELHSALLRTVRSDAVGYSEAALSGCEGRVRAIQEFVRSMGRHCTSETDLREARGWPLGETGMPSESLFPRGARYF